MEVVVRRPMTERKRIPMAKVRLRLENGTRMTIIDWGEIRHGLMLLLPLETALLGLFIRATTCKRLGLWILWILRREASKIEIRLDLNCERQNFTPKKLYI